MTLITILLVFILGYAFGAWGVTFLDNLINTIAVLFQVLQGKMAVVVTRDAVTATKIKQEIDPSDETGTRAIGFTISTEEDEDEYEDDE